MTDHAGAVGSLEEETPTDGRYRILRQLGQGGMGRVYLAEKLGPDGRAFREVVIKTPIPKSHEDDPTIADRVARLFLDEMAVTAGLEHRNIVRVTDWGQDFAGSQHYFEMEKIEGVSVLELMRHYGSKDAEGIHRWGPLSPKAVAWIGMQAAAGLHYAHNHRRARGSDGESGVVHRDVSPDNLMGDVKGEVKVADWGITKVLNEAGDASKTGTMMGKIKYMPPEQIRGEPIDGRADVYALGITLTAALSGRDVFTPANGLHPTLMNILTKKRESAAEMAPNAPKVLTDLLEEMMEPDRGHRPRTAAIVVQRLKDIVIALCGDLHSAQEAFAQEIQAAYAAKNAGASTHAQDPPTTSTRRPITPATDRDPSSAPAAPAQLANAAPLPPQSARTPEPPNPGLAATAQLPVTHPAPAAVSHVPPAPSVAPAPSQDPSPRKIMVTALVVGLLILSGMVAAWIGFFAFDFTAFPSRSDDPNATTEPETAGPERTDDTAEEQTREASDPPAAEVSTVRIQIYATPPLAEMELDGESITNPFDADLPIDDQTHTLTVHAEGYASDQREFRIRHPQRIVVALQEVEPERSSRTTRTRPRPSAPTPRPVAQPTPTPTPTAPTTSGDGRRPIGGGIF